MRDYAVRISMEIEAQDLGSVESKLEKVRKLAERKGFHVQELSIRGLGGGSYTAQLAMETEARNGDSAESKLDRVRQAAEQVGFHLQDPTRDAVGVGA